MVTLINEERGEGIDTIVLEMEKSNVLSPERIEILKLALQRPLYAAEMARELKIPIARIYYHIRMLEKTKLLKFEGYKEINGAIAKRYMAKNQAVSIIIGAQWRTYIPKNQIKAPRYIAPFVRNGFFESLMVLGSPDPHGKYRARASDLGMLELAMYLGQYAAFNFPLYRLDTQIKTEDKMRNLILAGGPKVNTLVAEVNEQLPIKFASNMAEVRSAISNESYGENIGVIELIKNPYNRSSSVLVIGGLNQHGTRAAVIALVKKSKEIEGGNKYKRQVIAKVIEGFDEDGDGIVDQVEIRE